ncbi:A/G-specific adenine glycosylase [Candidatus Woesearchaeota archaeon]|nr:A/G-specific adenine glycosylase [Candidatus Woesearchaeota archaeon]
MNKKQKIQTKILSWYAKNKRDLPWRKTTDPYKILISEVMLQQTQVDRVIPYYERWLKQFPDFKSLAKAEKAMLLQHWSGLGYNNRALRLQQLAQIITERYHNKMPENEEALLALPGIGPYTAHAILAFAFNKEVPVLDTNIRRVLIHELKLKENTEPERLRKIAKEIIPKNKSRIWHNALMDYGALIVTAKKTGIASLSKQSKFEGSPRQVRGAIIRLLLKEKKLSLKRIQKEFPHPQLKTIVEKMEKEGMVNFNKDRIQLRN